MLGCLAQEVTDGSESCARLPKFGTRETGFLGEQRLQIHTRTVPVARTVDRRARSRNRLVKTAPSQRKQLDGVDLCRLRTGSSTDDQARDQAVSYIAGGNCTSTRRINGPDIARSAIVDHREYSLSPLMNATPRTRPSECVFFLQNLFESDSNRKSFPQASSSSYLVQG